MKQFVLFFIMILLTSCTGASEEIIFLWGDSDIRYEVDKTPDCSRHKAFEYSVWRGETAFAQAIIWTESDMRDVSVTATSLKGKQGMIPKEVVKTQFVKYVWADEFIEGYSQCGYRPKGVHDSLIVADMVDIIKKTDISAGHCQPIWVTVKVPSSILPGTYSGSLVLKGRGFRKSSLPIEIKVIDEELPPPSDWKFHLDLWQNPYSVARYHEVEPWSKEHFELMRPVMQKLADAGQKVITATILDRPWNGQTEDAYGSMVKKIRKADGSWMYDYTIFDKWVEFMMSLGIDRQINCYSLIPWKLGFDYLDEESGNILSLNAAPGSSDYEFYWGNFISDFSMHLKEKGWFDRTCIAMDERPVEAMRFAYETIMTVEPEFKISLAGNWHPDIESCIYDYSVAFRQEMPRFNCEERRAKNKISTYYTCCAERYPNIFTISPLEEAVWIPLYALANGYDGYLRWAYNHWTANPLIDTRFRTWTAGDCYCIYPEGRSSLRFDKLLEGIQDYEKAIILMERWKNLGNEAAISELKTALAAFDYETITSEGPSKAIRDVKMLLNQ